jgi:hypothetical protein
VTVVAFLVRSAWKDLRRPDRVPDDAGPDPRVPLFAETTGALWFVALVTSLGWRQAGGGWESLGFMLLPGWGAVAAWTVAVLAAAFLWFQWRTAVRSEEARARYAAQANEARGFDWIRPTTPREYRLFRWMAVTAGITEEVVFRGFLIGVLASWMPLWAAALAALVVFVGAHVYQGPSGMLRILPVSAVLTFLFLISGTLFPGIVLHAAVDLAAGAILWEVRDRRAAPGDPGEDRARPAS